MGRELPFVLHDREVAAAAVAAAAGAWLGGGPGVLAGGLLVVAALGLRRSVLVVAGIGVLAAGLADRAMDGLDPAPAGEMSGWVRLVDDPVERDSGEVRVTVHVDGRRLEARAFGRAAARLDSRLAGEWVHLAGSVRPTGGERWLVARRIVGRLTVDEVGEWRAGSVAARLANGIRRTLEAGAGHLPLEHRTLLTGIVLGDDREQPPEVADDFRAAGLSHLLAVSGSNVAFVLLVASPVLGRLRRVARVPSTLAVLACFALVVRFEPSVLRAASMAGVAVIAAGLGRPAEGVRVLGLAVTGLLLVDPLLVRSVGFGLSVGASAGILVLAPGLRTRLPGPAWLREPMAVTLGAQLGALPLLLVIFGGLPVAGVVANLVAVPAAGALMVWGLTGGLLAGLLGEAGLGGIAAGLHAPTSVLAWWLAGAARTGASLPLGTVGPVATAALAGMAAVAWGLDRVASRHRRTAPGAALAALLAVVVLAHPAPAPGANPVAGVGTVWVGGGMTVLELEGRTGAERALDALGRLGVRCVDVVAVAREGRVAASVAAALARRCDGTVVVAPEGRAHPGWLALDAGEVLPAGPVVVSAGDRHGLAVVPAGRFDRDAGRRRPSSRARRRRAPPPRRPGPRRRAG